MTTDSLSKDDRDLCFKQAIQELIDDRLIRKPMDYAWIMTAVEQGAVKDFEPFPSHQSFIDYLDLLGVKELPSRTTLFRAYAKISGVYPQWVFTDGPKQGEKLRRNTIVVRFLSAYSRAKRTFRSNK